MQPVSLELKVEQQLARLGLPESLECLLPALLVKPA